MSSRHKDSKIYIAGHRGMVGSAVWRALEAKGYVNLIGKTSKELDLRNQQAVIDFIEFEKPDIIIDSAARVGGILANNDNPYPFLMENLQIQNKWFGICIFYYYIIHSLQFLGDICGLC